MSSLHPLQRAVQLAEPLRNGNPRPGRFVSAPPATQFEVLASCSLREPLPHFAQWVVQQLGWKHRVENGDCHVEIPEDVRHELNGQEVVAFRLDDYPPAHAPNGHGPEDVQVNGSDTDRANSDGSSSLDASASLLQLTPHEPFFQWLCEKLGAEGVAVHTRPRHDPQSVYEISEPLFRAYRIDGGCVHLSGCTLQEQPFLRLTYASGDVPSEVKQLFFTPDGKPADRRVRDALGLSDLCCAKSQHGAAGDFQAELLVAAGKRFIQNFARVTDSVDIGVVGDPLIISLAWVKRAVGRLRFTIGEQSVDLPFEGWAQTLQPPALVCPESGISSYHIAATDDGRITAAEAIGTCARSGRRVLAGELVTCSVTGERVLPQYTHLCPVSGKPALDDAFADCYQCQQHVSRVVLKNGVCEGCRSLAAVAGDDPRLVWLLSEYPPLEAWKRWRFSETASLYIAVGTKLFRHLLVVLDKETLNPLHVATRGRFRKAWYELDPTEQQELFAERAMAKPQ